MKQTKVSVLMASMKEPETIGKALETLVSGWQGDLEILLSIPDEPTILAAKEKLQSLGLLEKTYFSELALDGKPKGKPTELNYLLDRATGDFWVFGDGDTYFELNTIQKLVDKFTHSEIWLVTGKPVSADQPTNAFAYYGALLASAAHHKRIHALSSNNSHQKTSFFPVSGYLYASRPYSTRFPNDCLVEDAYVSYDIVNQGYKIAYAPEAIVYVYYPKNYVDFMKQKKRSVGGYLQLGSYGLFKLASQSRSIWHEIQYIWFPISYAKNLKEFWWSLMLYPLRAWLWLKIYWERRILKKGFFQTWQRVDSSKG